MSMFIVSDEEYQKLATMLTASTGEHAVYWTLKLTANSQDADNLEEIKEFVNKVIKLNHIAAFGRYGDAVDNRNIMQITELLPSQNIVDVQALYRLVSTVNYQCSEDIAIETDTYKKLQELKWRLADHIAQGVAYE